MEGSLDAGSIPASSIKKTPSGVFFMERRESNGETEERSDERTTRWVVHVDARPERQLCCRWDSRQLHKKNTVRCFFCDLRFVS